jgi:acyl carrier protein
MKMSKKLFDIIAQVMAVPVSEINDKSSPENIESWDSFNGLVLLDELENSFNVKFSLEEIIDVKTVEDIKKHLKNQGVNLDE